MSARCEEGRTMSNYRIKSLKWLAPVAMVGALGVAACGRDSGPDTVEANSGNRAAQAAQAERYVEVLQDRAESNSGNPAEELANRELAFRAALAHQAERYVEQQKDRAESNSTGDESSDEFVPGSRHMPVK